MNVDELAAALCNVQRRDDIHHDRYPGANQPCVDCLELARRVADELRPAPRVQ